MSNKVTVLHSFKFGPSTLAKVYVEVFEHGLMESKFSTNTSELTSLLADGLCDLIREFEIIEGRVPLISTALTMAQKYSTLIDDHVSVVGVKCLLIPELINNLQKILQAYIESRDSTYDYNQRCGNACQYSYKCYIKKLKSLANIHNIFDCSEEQIREVWANFKPKLNDV